MTKSKRTIAVIAGLLLSGFIMRAPITAPPLMLSLLANAPNVAASRLGVLTTIPLVMFVLSSGLAARVMAKIGLHRALVLSLLLLVAGSLLRLVAELPAMLIGTAVIGIAIAHLNVLMPVLCVAYFPTRVGLFTSAYTLALTAGTTMFSVITMPLAKTAGWRSVMMLLLGLAVLALIAWVLAPADTVKPGQSKARAAKTGRSMWRRPAAWAFLFAFGMQLLMNYTITAWLPTLMAYHHVTTGQISLVMGAYSLTNLPPALLLPGILTRWSRRGTAWLVAVAGSLGLIGNGLLLAPTSAVGYWLAVCLTLGLAISFFFIMAMTLFAVKTSSPVEAASLSGMAQTGGYLLAACGPLFYGMAYGVSPTGLVQVIVGLVLAVVMVLAGWQMNRVAQV